MFPNRLSNEFPLSEGQAPKMTEGLVQSIASLPSHLRTLFDDLPEHPPSAATEPDAAFNLHTLLSVLDPLVANRWHWKDTRKTFRSLSIIKESGRQTSDIIKDQTQDTSASTPRFIIYPTLFHHVLTGNRFRTLCFWLYAEPSILESRLNERIDKMIEVFREKAVTT